MNKKIEVIVFRKAETSYEFLILHRKPERGNWWQPITGSVETYDKSNFDAALRELWEEAGLAGNNILSIFENYYNFQFTEEGIAYEEFCYGIEINCSVSINISNNIHKEHDQYKWLAFEDAISILKWDNNKCALTELNSILVSKK